MSTFEQILFEVNVNMLEDDVDTFRYCINTPETEIPEDYQHMLYAVLANAKATEEDPVVTSHSATKGTRRPGNRADRRKAYKAKKHHLEAIEPFTMSVRPVGKSGFLRQGNGDFHKLCKRMDNRIERNSGKEICRNYIPDNYVSDYAKACDDFDRYCYPDDYDPLVNPWGYKYDEEIYHGDYSDDDIQKIIAAWNNYDYDFDDDDYDYDPYQSAIDDREAAWKTIADLQREIDRYHKFINEFNLGTLFQRWMENNLAEGGDDSSC